MPSRSSRRKFQIGQVGHVGHIFFGDFHFFPSTCALHDGLNAAASPHFCGDSNHEFNPLNAAQRIAIDRRHIARRQSLQFALPHRIGHLVTAEIPSAKLSALACAPQPPTRRPSATRTRPHPPAANAAERRHHDFSNPVSACSNSELRHRSTLRQLSNYARVNSACNVKSILALQFSTRPFTREIPAAQIPAPPPSRPGSLRVVPSSTASRISRNFGPGAMSRRNQIVAAETSGSRPHLLWRNRGQFLFHEFIRAEMAVAGQRIGAVQRQVLVETRHAQKFLQRGFAHPRGVAKAHVIVHQRENLLASSLPKTANAGKFLPPS